MEWNVLHYTVNNDLFQPFNIFNHRCFYQDCKEAYHKHRNNKKEFLEAIRSSLMYYYWCKSEWELVTSPWLSSQKIQNKIDVYYQVMLNWEVFSEYIWKHRKELAEEEKNG